MHHRIVAHRQNRKPLTPSTDLKTQLRENPTLIAEQLFVRITPRIKIKQLLTPNSTYTKSLSVFARSTGVKVVALSKMKFTFYLN